MQACPLCRWREFVAAKTRQAQFDQEQQFPRHRTWNENPASSRREALWCLEVKRNDIFRHESGLSQVEHTNSSAAGALNLPGIHAPSGQSWTQTPPVAPSTESCVVPFME